MSADDETANAQLARIWAVVRQIPCGCVATYGQVASEAGIVRGARLAARALRLAPAHLQLPWHRVINAQGRIAIPESDAAHLVQKRRLESEGVRFVGTRVNLQLYRWRPRSDSPLLD